MKNFQLILTIITSSIVVSCEKPVESEYVCSGTDCYEVPPDMNLTGFVLYPSLSECQNNCLNSGNSGGSGGGNAGNDPTGFKITRISISNFPTCLSDGTPIDDEYSGDNPDLFVEVFNKASGTFRTGVSYDKVQVDYPNLNWNIKSMTMSTLVRIYDEDQVGAVSVNKFLLPIGFDGDDLLDEPDNAYSVQIQDKFSSQCYPYGNKSWVRIYFEFIY